MHPGKILFSSAAQGDIGQYIGDGGQINVKKACVEG
jgi:hypothetical protein